MNGTIAILAVAAVAFLMNLPLGQLRTRCRKYGVAWFAAIHASIPAIVVLRLALGIAWAWAPVFVACAVAGQWIGGRGTTSAA